MAILSGTVIYKGKEKIVRPSFKIDIVKDLNKLMRTENKWYMSLDPSTSCTGFYFINGNRDVHIILDYDRDNGDKYDFKRGIKNILNLMMMNVDMQGIVMEKPLEHGYRRAAAVLYEFRGMLKEILIDMPELKNVNIMDIHPMTWKSAIVDKSKGKNRINKKECIAEDLVDAMPFLKGHLERCPSKDLDSFDAIGIFYGFFKKRLTEDGESLNFGEIEPKHTTLVIPHYIDANKVERDNYYEFFLKFPVTVKNMGVRKTKYNHDYSFHKNMKFASSSCKNTIIVIDDVKTTLNLCWKLNVDYDSNKRWLLVVLKNSLGRESDMKTIRALYPHFLIY